MKQLKKLLQSPPLGLLGALFLIFLIERGIARQSFYVMSPDQWIFSNTNHNLEDWTRGRDYLVFGDSQLKHAFAPREVEAETGIKGYNLALSGSQAANSYFLLRRALASGAKPKVVLVDFFPPLQRLSHWHASEYDPYLLTLRESFEYAVRARDIDFFGSMLARKAFASFRERLSLRHLTINRLLGSGEPNFAGTNHILIRNHLANEGTHITPTGHLLPTDPVKLNDDYFPHWEISGLQEAFIRDFLDLAESQGIRVAWVFTPFQEKLQECTRASGFDQAWTDYVASWTKRYSHLVVIDGRGLTYPDSAFFDPNHLSRAGVVDFTHRVAQILPELASDSPSRTWYRFEGGLTVTESGHVEDVVQTGEIIKANVAARDASRLNQTRTR